MRALTIAAPPLLTSLPGRALAQQVTMEALLDRIQIEDLLTRYYYDLSQGKAHELSDDFTEDAMLDVDGTIARGRAEIARLYGGGPARDANAAPRPQNHLVLTNPVIEVRGNRAMAHVIWTCVSNSGVGKPPTVTEQGREDSARLGQIGRSEDRQLRAASRATRCLRGSQRGSAKVLTTPPATTATYWRLSEPR